MLEKQWWEEIKPVIYQKILARGKLVYLATNYSGVWQRGYKIMHPFPVLCSSIVVAETGATQFDVHIKS